MRSLCFLAPVLLATTIPAASGQTYTAAKIVFNHPGQYSQAQLEAAAGMHVGATFTADDLGNAAQRLADSGFFDKVGGTVQGSLKATTVLFDVSPIDRTQLLHVGFENFVWLSHSEIEDALRAKAPLFQDYLPENSPLQDVFATVLTQALAAKGITAKVAYDTEEPTLAAPERTVEFRIATPSIRVANVKLGGVSPDLVPLIQKSVNAAAKSPYNEGLAGGTTQDAILAPLLDAGYIQASLSKIALAPAVTSDGASVILSATLIPGEVYHVAGISFAGSPLLSAEAFAATEKLHAGDVASRARLIETLMPLDTAYRRQGYMDVVVQAAPAIDANAHQVAYTVSVTPGEQYRIHQVTTNNLDPAGQADFERGFLMKAGELYNPEYVRTFLIKNTALKALEEYSATYKAYADTNTHTVDLVVTFVRGGRR